jgi:hypothetical protein
VTDDTTREQSHEDREEQTPRVKVTDKRMFGPDGELREEYSFLQEERKAEPEGAARKDRREGPPETRDESTPPRRSASEPAEAATAETAETAAGVPGRAAGAARETAAEAGRDPGGEDPGPFGRPSFFDLVSILAEPVAVYLGDVRLPDGRNAENLDMARFHIDLLDILKKKTEGRLSDPERAALEDLLYRLRIRFVQKRDAERSNHEKRSNIETAG